VEDDRLKARIDEIHGESRGTYGVPRIYVELKEEDERVGRKRIARLMRDLGLRGVCRRRFVKTTRRDDTNRPAPDLVERNFSASKPNELWVADATYIPTWEGFLFLAVVLDVFSRRIVGWAMANHLRTEVMLDALTMAVAQRRPEGVIHHSDQGSQYTSIAFGNRSREMGVQISMGSVGDCYDNAMVESFFATLECELIDRTTFHTRKEAQLEVFDFIEAFYNRKRRHSSIDYLSPVNFERRFAESNRSDSAGLLPK
jgi:transposase InsO family protein